MSWKKYALTCMVVILATVGGAQAQMFSPDGLKQQPIKKTSATEPVKVNQPQNENNVVSESGVSNRINEVLAQGNKAASDNPLDHIVRDTDKSENKPEQDEKEQSTEDEEDIFIPEGELYRLNSPTLDGSVRGGQAFVEVDDKGRMKKASKIFLYYDQFEMANFLSHEASCNVRFNILSNLDQKINRLDVKLVWPGLTTTLSFSDVAPNTQTYYNYSLLGNGCYNMDKAPNIVVNRCRVKGMTAAECANKIVWLSK